MAEPSSVSPASSTAATPAAAAEDLVSAGPAPSLVPGSDSPAPVTQSLSSLHQELADARHQVSQLKESNDKLKDQLLQATRRENILILRLASKDKALMELKVMICFVLHLYFVSLTPCP
jgi:small-conductance mechanosensitive channel